MDIVTNIEQSKRLVACGLEPKTADVYRVFDPYTKAKYSELKRIMDDSFDANFDLPAWSFVTLWEMMPTHIPSNVLEHKNWIDSKELTSDALMYSDSMIDGRGGMFYHIQVKFYYEKGHLMDAAVSMMEWLAQRKLIKTKTL